MRNEIQIDNHVRFKIQVKTNNNTIAVRGRCYGFNFSRVSNEKQRHKQPVTGHSWWPLWQQNRVTSLKKLSRGLSIG